MRTSGSPFKSRYTSGRCPLCRKRITEGQSIVKLDKPVSWIEQKKLVPRGGGRFFTDLKSSQYAHAQCINEKEQDNE